MKRGLYLALGVLASLPGRAQDAAEVFARVKDSVVLIQVYGEGRQYDGQGSGVVIAPGAVLTNCHVVDDAREIDLLWHGERHAARLRFRDSARDLCQVESLGLPAPAVDIAPLAEAKPGQAVFAVGNPLGLELTLSSGLLSSVGGAEEARGLVTTAPVSPGSSGGGLFDARGRLLGITTAILEEKLNLAAPAAWARDLPARHRDEDEETEHDINWAAIAARLGAERQWPALLTHVERWVSMRPQDDMALYYLSAALRDSGQPEKAEAVAAQGMAAAPDNPLHQRNRGLARFDLKQVEPALADLEAVKAKLPWDMSLMQRLAGLYGHQGRHDEARVLFARLVKLSPGVFEQWYGLGLEHSALQDWQGAEQAFNAALRIKPDDASTQFYLAGAYAKLDNPAAARPLLERVVALDKTNAKAWYLLYWVYRQLNEHGLALSALREAAALGQPEAKLAINVVSGAPVDEQALAKTLSASEADTAGDAEGLRMLGLQLVGMARDAEGVALLERSHRAKPLDDADLMALGQAYSRLRRYRDVVETLQPVLARKPANAELLITLAFSQTQIGHVDEAERLLQALPQPLSPELDKRARRVKALAYAQHGALERARQELAQLTEENPMDELLLNDLGYTLIRMGRPRDAVGVLERSVKLNPDLPVSIINLGEAYARSRQLGKAVAAYERALTFAPKAIDVLLPLGRLYASLNRLADSARYLRDAARVAPRNADVWQVLGAVLLADGQLDESERALDEAQRLRPEWGPTWFSRAQLHWMRKDMSAMRAALARLDALDPERAALFRDKVLKAKP